MSKGVSFGELAAILLVLFILMALILLFVTQRERLATMLSGASDIGDKGLLEAQQQIDEILGSSWRGKPSLHSGLRTLIS